MLGKEGNFRPSPVLVRAPTNPRTTDNPVLELAGPRTRTGTNRVVLFLEMAVCAQGSKNMPVPERVPVLKRAVPVLERGFF